MFAGTRTGRCRFAPCQESEHKRKKAENFGWVPGVAAVSRETEKPTLERRLFMSLSQRDSLTQYTFCTVMKRGRLVHARPCCLFFDIVTRRDMKRSISLGRHLGCDAYWHETTLRSARGFLFNLFSRREKERRRERRKKNRGT